MAGNQRNGQTEKAHRTNRRSFIRAAGVTATATAVGTASTGAAASARTVIDLGEQGLRNGEVIDSYLEEFFVGGTEVHVPAGEYDYTGAGLSGEKADCALVGSPDGVTLVPRSDSGVEDRPLALATEGTVRIANITLLGESLGEPDSGLAPLPNRIEIDGTGDAAASARYEFTVTGALALDEGYTVVGSGEPLLLRGDMGTGSISGHVRTGADAFFYSGQLERLDIDGDAAITVFNGYHDLEN